MAKRWMVSILSTGYDLSEYRQDIITLLKKNNFDVSAYELPEYPVEPNLHSHDSCIVALDRADIAVVIIDKRSGGVYCGEDDNSPKFSITEKEYLKAIEKGIPVLVFVRKSADDERLQYKKSFKLYCKAKGYKSQDKDVIKKYYEEFDKEYECTYVEKPQTLHFIQDVQDAYTRSGVSNWMYYFKDENDLLESIEGKFKGLSRFILQRLVTLQKESVLMKHTSTAIDMSLGDVFESNYYITPPYIITSGNRMIKGKHSEICGVVNEILEDKKSILIYGDAGYGKTTVISKCFKEHVEKLEVNPAYTIPMYILLRNKGADYSFNIVKYIGEETEELMEKEPYPYLDISQIQICFYCDGFDELAESIDESALEKIRESEVFKAPIALTCRQQYANRYLTSYCFSDKFGVKALMKVWDMDMLEKYILNAYYNSGKDEEEAKQIIDEIRDSSDLQQMLDTPLLVSMFMFFWKSNQKIFRFPIFHEKSYFQIGWRNFRYENTVRIEHYQVNKFSLCGEYLLGLFIYRELVVINLR